MHVAIVAPNAQRVGGAETYLLNVVEALVVRGVRVTFLHRSAGHAEIGDVEFHHLPAARDIVDRLAALPDAIVHLHDDALGPDESASLAESHAFVRSMHNLWFVCGSGTLLRGNRHACPRAHGPGCLGPILRGNCLERVDRRPALRHWREVNTVLPVVRAAPTTVVYSDYARSVAVRNGVPADRCHVLRYFVDRAPAPLPVPAEARICFAGRLTKLKGVDTLLHAVAGSRTVEHLDVVGDGYHRADLETLARRLNVSDRVTFHGWGDQRLTEQLMSEAALVVVPSRWPEPFGIVGLEAMALGRPVVGSAIGGIPEWLEDGTTGVLVPPSIPGALTSAIDSSLADHARLVEWGEAAWRGAERFAPSRHHDALLALYAEASAGRG